MQFTTCNTKTLKTHLRETAKYYTVWRDPISGLVLDYGLDFKKQE